jgi:hypothetical protein
MDREVLDHSPAASKTAALARAREATDVVPQRARKLMAPARLDFASSRRVIHSRAAGLTAYVIPRGADQLCLMSVEASGDVGLGCNSRSQFTGSRGFALLILLGSNEPNGQAKIVGAAAADVARVDVQLSNPVSVAPNPDGGFLAQTTVRAVHSGAISLQATTSRGELLERLAIPG